MARLFFHMQLEHQNLTEGLTDNIPVKMKNNLSYLQLIRRQRRFSHNMAGNKSKSMLSGHHGALTLHFRHQRRQILTSPTRTFLM
jgi:hypothetical protein